MRLRELRMDWKVVTTIIVSTLLLTIDYYHRLFPYHVLDRLFLYLVVPLIIIILFYRESPAKYGFRIGDWRAGMVITSIGILGAAVVIFFVAQTDVFQEYYAPLANLTIPMPIYTALELFGWEFLFRGFLLFSLYTVIGPYAIVLQAVPFALAHLGKPELETILLSVPHPLVYFNCDDLYRERGYGMSVVLNPFSLIVRKIAETEFRLKK